MSKTQTHATVKVYKDGKIAGYEDFTLPGKLSKQEVKTIVTEQYGYEVISVTSCIYQTSK